MSWQEKLTIDGLPYYYNSGTEEITWDKPEALMSKEEQAEEAGKWVWIPHETQLWQPGRITKENPDGSFQVAPRSGRPFTIAADKKFKLTDRTVDVEFWPVKLAQLNRPSEDLVQMRDVNDASIINNIRLRYIKNELYTWVGAAKSVLISVNPYKTLPLYGNEAIDTYRTKPPNTHIKPHVYDIANDSYNSLLFDNQNQSILISGESGAGKTVCTKQCLDFLARVAGSEQSDIEEKILLANPLLEAFGNAQTIRNNNSSRFGKWIEVYFDPMERKISSAKIINYLLEKSRLVTQAKNERNYHVFYQLTTDPTAQKDYELDPPQSYHYTNQSGLYKAHLIDDNKDFKEVQDAFKMLNFSDEEREFVLSTTAGILVLGNCEFNVADLPNGVTGSALRSKAPMEQAARLMGFTEAGLEEVLTFRSITVRGTVTKVPLNPEVAASAKDSLAMGIYSRLFDFLVRKVNESLQGKEGKFIGILDIFGFEIFDQNSFEQLCINFANEKLQQQFNSTTFREEEELYEKEGIEYTHIVFYDNQPVLDMIEKYPKGILPLLDDELIVPEGSDAKFMNRMEEAHAANDKLQTDTHRKLKDVFNFEIVHYAGVVKYNGENFMQKNTDNLYQDMYDLCGGNSNKIFASMFPKVERRKMKSLSAQFRTQLNELMEGLHKTESRYIRCVKPNGKQVPNDFDSFLVIDQLRYSGVFEAVEIRKQGFPFRFSFAQFSCRYSCVNRKYNYRSSSKSFKERCHEILQNSTQKATLVPGCVFGKTMVLFKTPEFSTLELLRNLALETIIPKMQAVCKGHLAREMKRRCIKLGNNLSAAFEKQNDLPMVTKAIDDVHPELGHFKSIFPGYFPKFYYECIELKKKLEAWVVVEDKLVKLLQEDPNKVYYDLYDTLMEGEKLRQQKFPETDSQTKLMADAKHARENCILGKIDLESEACFQVLDLERMKKVRADAEKYNHSTETTKQIASVLDKSEIEIVRLELEKAIEMNDEKRKIHREIRLFHLELEETKNKYSNAILRHGCIRDPTDYAKASMFGKAKKAEMMMKWTKAPTISNLTNLDAQKPELKLLQKQAKEISKNVRMFMGDKPVKPAGSSENACAATICGIAMAEANRGMVNEAYFQVIKQLHENPTTESTNKGYQLLGVFLGTFLPEDEVLKLVLVFLQERNQDIQKFNAIWHETKYGKQPKGRDATGVQNLIQELSQGQGRSRFSLVAGEPTGPHI